MANSKNEPLESSLGLSPQEPAGSEQDSSSPWTPILWQRRRLIVAVATIVAVAAVAAFLLLPTQRMMIQKFRLVFDGAGKGLFPSGVPFGPEDIVSRSVLSEVFEKSQLAQYGKFDDFQLAFYVSSTPSPRLEALDADFNAKLSNPKLTLVERNQLEKDYADKRNGLLNSVNLMLNMDIDRPIVRAMPATVREKVLNSILGVWAEQAVQRKGATKYQIPVLGKNILQKDFLTDEEYFIAMDILQEKFNKLLATIDGILTLPGAKTFRSAGPDGMRLVEIRSNLEDTLQFKLQPLMNNVRTCGVFRKDKEVTLLYIQGRLFDIMLRKKETADRAKVLAEAVESYSQNRRGLVGEHGTADGGAPGASSLTGKSGGVTAMIPQLGESFLDRIVDLAGKNTDLAFRQDMTERIAKEGIIQAKQQREETWYKDMLAAFTAEFGDAASRPFSPSDAGRAEISASVQGKIDSIFQDLATKAGQVESLYDQITASNLNARTEMYLVQEAAYKETERSLSLVQAAMYGVFLLIASVFATSALCIARARGRERNAGRTGPANMPAKI